MSGWMVNYLKKIGDFSNAHWVAPQFDRLQEIADNMAIKQYFERQRYPQRDYDDERERSNRIRQDKQSNAYQVNRDTYLNPTNRKKTDEEEHAASRMEQWKPAIGAARDQTKNWGICGGVTGVWLWGVLKHQEGNIGAETLPAKHIGKMYHSVYKTFLISHQSELAAKKKMYKEMSEQLGGLRLRTKLLASGKWAAKSSTDVSSCMKAIDGGLNVCGAIEFGFDCGDGKTRGAHVIGLHRNIGGSIYVFDANFGLCRYSDMAFLGKDMEAFMKIYHIAAGEDWEVRGVET